MFPRPNKITSQSELIKETESGVLVGEITLSGRGVKSLTGIKKVIGDLSIYDTAIEEIESLEEVTGDLNISNSIFKTELNSLGSIRKVGGDVRLRYSLINDLGKLEEVEGDLNLRGLELSTMGNLRRVGGKLFLSKTIEDVIDLSGVEVDGDIRFWNPRKNTNDLVSIENLDDSHNVPKWTSIIYSLRNLSSANKEQIDFYKIFRKNFENGNFIDLKGNNSYLFILYYDYLDEYKKGKNLDLLISKFDILKSKYPEIEVYTKSAIEVVKEKLFKIKSSDKEIWERDYKRGHLDLFSVIQFQEKLKKSLVDAKVILNWGSSTLTPFGFDNISRIMPFVQTTLEEFENEHKVRFLEVFLRTEEEVESSDNRILITPLQLNKKNWTDYNAEFYKEFYVNENEYNYERQIDDSHLSFDYYSRGSIPRVVSGAIFSQCRKLCRTAEDYLRESMGVPKIGEGWISETSLFYQIDEALENYEVIHHGSPKWLGRQHLDVYIPELNIAVEYQGRQHSEPIDFFGGKEAFDKNQERDERKKKLCDENGVTLLYVYPETDREVFLIDLKELVQKKSLD